MIIQINTDRNVEGTEGLAAYVTGLVEDALSRFADRITRIEVHLADENGEKSGDADKRCSMEVRLQHRQPTAVTHHAATLHEAIQGATDKLKRLLESTVGRLDDH